MDFSRFFIDRPIFAAVLSILIFITGLIAIPLLPVSEYPDVVPPSVQVRAEYPGANPKVIAETVATPLEEAINGVENMMYMKSVAGSDGVLVTTVTFRPGTDPDQAQVQVKPRIAGRSASAGRCAASGYHYPETVADADAGGASVFAQR
jgi:multidrug efflux pump